MKVWRAFLPILLCSPLALSSHGFEWYEAQEPYRLELDSLGQRNGVPEAIENEGSILDGVYLFPSPDLSSPPLGDSYRDAYAGFSDPHRSTGGLLPPLVLPGPSRFIAWKGYWTDYYPPDGILSYRRGPTGSPLPDNEWTPRFFGSVVAFLEPGPHPDFTDSRRPTPSDPDLYFVPNLGGAWSSSTSVVVFLDGSLLRDLWVWTLSDALLSPDEEGRPYTMLRDSLLDIDLYAALLSGPFSPIFDSALGPLLDEVGSPGLGLCPYSCSVVPWRTGGPGPVATVEGMVWARHLQRTDPSVESSMSGNLERYQREWGAWIDVLPTGGLLFRGLPPSNTPYPGATREGRPAAYPGIMGFKAWTGVWKDLNGDGFVGDSSDPDPYEGGSRPLADDYRNPKGEFLPASPSSPLSVLLLPDPNWGSGVFLWPSALSPPPVGLAGSLDPHHPEEFPSHLSNPRESLGYVSGGPLVIPMVLSTNPGEWDTSYLLILPEGTLGFSFKACVQGEITFSTAGIEIHENVWTCEKIHDLLE